MNSIPIDLVFEIFSRLPAKSIARCSCVSKLWRSMLHSPYFTELFLTRSSARPRLLFAVERDRVCRLFSSPQPQNPYDKSSHVVAADFHTKFSGNYCRYISGLIYFHNTWISQNGGKIEQVMCNPNTGQYVILPKHGRRGCNFLGFDPIDKQYKVLFMADPFLEARDHHQILTLGTGKLRWKKIQCPLLHYSFYGDICINGVLYYLAKKIDDSSNTIVCFDFRFEKFMFIDGDYTECFRYIHNKVLVNYKGKLGVTFWRFDGEAIELRIWVLEDAEKRVWSKYVYTLPKIQVVDPHYVSIAGVTAMGEIVLSMYYMSKPFYVFYFSPEKKTLDSVEIQGFEGFGVNHEENLRVHTFVEYVEDLKLNDAKLLKSSIPIPSGKNKRSQDHNREDVRKRDKDKRCDDGVNWEKKQREER